MQNHGSAASTASFHENVLPNDALAGQTRLLFSEKTLSSYRADIDGLRALAVIAVIAFHAFPKRLTGGFVGVDVFFVISGYLITGIILNSCLNGKFSISEFYSRRIRRIFPALALVLISTLLMGWPILSNQEYAKLGSHAAAGAGFVANLVFWGEAGYFDRAADEKPLLHLWSLGVEEQFYIVWPLLVWAMWRTGRHFALMLVAIGAVSFIFSLYQTSASPSAAFFSPLTRFWELLAGGYLASREAGLAGWTAGKWQPSEKTRGHSEAKGRSLGVSSNFLSFIGLALVILSMFTINGQSKFPGWWAAVPVAGTYLMLKTGRGSWIGLRLLSNPLMVWLGLISFPLYLWHWPLLSFAHFLYPTEPSKWVTVGAVAISVMLAWLTYVLLEQPLRLWSTPRRRVVALTCTMVAITAFSAALWKSGGAPGRFPGVVDELASFSYDYRADYREGSCFLRSDQTASEFQTCVEPATAKAKNLILLWGDSHAAHLYSGLRTNFDAENRIAQLTSHGCPPFMDHVSVQRKGCVDTNAEILKWATVNKPDVILMAAQWANKDPKLLTPTIDALKRLPNAPRIMVLGPVPTWSGGLPRILLASARRTPSQVSVPDRLTLSATSESYKAEAALQDHLKTFDIEYVSILNILCNASRECLTRTGPTVASLTAWDDAHLTAAGSNYVGAKLLADYFQSRAKNN